MAWITVREYAKRARCSERWVQKQMKAGNLRHEGEGHARLIFVPDEEPVEHSELDEGHPLYELELHLLAGIREIEWERLGPRLKEEVETTGAAFAQALYRARIASGTVKSSAPGFHL